MTTGQMLDNKVAWIFSRLPFFLLFFKWWVEWEPIKGGCFESTSSLVILVVLLICLTVKLQ